MAATAAHQPEPITREGYERLRAELEHLVTVRRRELADDLRAARADGAEPGENVGVAAVLEDQAVLERRIDELESSLSFVQIADPPADGVAGIGQRVEIRLGADSRPVACELVGPLESDPARGLISVDSPVGRALGGHRAGDVVQVETPRGPLTVEVLTVGDG